MREIKKDGNTFLVCDSIQEIPIERFFQFNLQVALEAGIGGDLESVVERNKELREWIRKGKTKEALQALNNMENSIAILLSSITPESNAFVYLVMEANGEKVTDLSQEGVSRYLRKWSKRGLTVGTIREIVQHVKKKFTNEVETFFQDDSVKLKDLERLRVLRSWSLARLRYIQGKATLDDVEKIDEVLMTMVKPIAYSGSKGFEVTKINSFEDSIIIIRKELNLQGPMTAHQFLKHSETVKTILEARKKANQPQTAKRKEHA